MSIRRIEKIVNRSDCLQRNYLRNCHEYSEKCSPGRLSKQENCQKCAIISAACNSTRQSRIPCDVTRVDINPVRIRQILNKCGYLKYEKMLHKPYITKQNIQDEMIFAISHVNWEDEWKFVIFLTKKNLIKMAQMDVHTIGMIFV